MSSLLMSWGVRETACPDTEPACGTELSWADGCADAAQGTSKMQITGIKRRKNSILIELIIANGNVIETSIYN
jgi:hypothetical protein